MSKFSKLLQNFPLRALSVSQLTGLLRVEWYNFLPLPEPIMGGSSIPLISKISVSDGTVGWMDLKTEKCIRFKIFFYTDVQSNFFKP